ncbi:MAG: hypothetical protein H7138_24400 [Myxococcales bacterium]|nr:hypothetical protein [Myxococcales bacterium]
MRKKASRNPSTRKPTARRSLQITKETVRTLSSNELTQIATGREITCPNSATQVPHDAVPIIKKD